MPRITREPIPTPPSQARRVSADRFEEWGALELDVQDINHRLELVQEEDFPEDTYDRVKACAQEFAARHGRFVEWGLLYTGEVLPGKKGEPDEDAYNGIWLRFPGPQDALRPKYRRVLTKHLEDQPTPGQATTDSPPVTPVAAAAVAEAA